MPLQTVGCQWNFSTAFNRNNGSKATNVAHSSLSPIKMGIYSHPSQHISNPSPSLSPKPSAYQPSQFLMLGSFSTHVQGHTLAVSQLY